MSQPFKIISPTSSIEMQGGVQVFNTAFGRTKEMVLESQTKLWLDYQKEQIADFRFAIINTQVVGTCALFRYDTFGWIGFMAVDPPFQNRHIAKGLFNEIVTLNDSYHLPTARLDATKFGRRVYVHFGFQDEYPTGMYELPPLNRFASYNFEKPVIASFMPEWLLEKDTQIYGANRDKFLLYLLKTGTLLIGKDRSYAFIVEDRVGPVIASNWEIALDLVHTAKELGVKYIYIPHHPELPSEYLQKLAIVEGQGRMCIRMIRGPPIEEKNSNIFAFHAFSTG